jgi:hypothetical protein
VNNNCSKKVLGGTAAQSIIRGLLVALVALADAEASRIEDRHGSMATGPR